VQQAEAARSSNMMESTVSVLGGLFGGRKSASSLGAAARRHQSASTRVATAQSKLDDLRLQRQDLENELANEILDINADWDAKAAAMEPVAVELKKTNVRITDLRLVWIPVA
jgi:peptidoglycan hydrolase CwlO-like protein